MRCAAGCGSRGIMTSSASRARPTTAAATSPCRSSRRRVGSGWLWRFSFVACVAVATPLASQVVTGAVVDSAMTTPVGEGFVVLLGEGGREVARTLTGADGRFSLRAPRPGRYRLRSERIGYVAFVAPPFDL